MLGGQCTHCTKCTAACWLAATLVWNDDLKPQPSTRRPVIHTSSRQTNKQTAAWKHAAVFLHPENVWAASIIFPFLDYDLSPLNPHPPLSTPGLPLITEQPPGFTAGPVDILTGRPPRWPLIAGWRRVGPAGPSGSRWGGSGCRRPHCSQSVGEPSDFPLLCKQRLQPARMSAVRGRLIESALSHELRGGGEYTASAAVVRFCCGGRQVWQNDHKFDLFFFFHPSAEKASVCCD